MLTYSNTNTINKFRLIGMAVITTLLVSCGGSSESESEEPLSFDDELAMDTAQSFDSAILFSIGDQAPGLFDIPLLSESSSPDRPQNFSAPSTIQITSDSVAQVELGYNVTAPIRTLNIGQLDVNEHLSFELESPTDVSATQQTVVFTVSLSQSDSDEVHCYEVSVSDINNLNSESKTICIEAVNDESVDEARTIYFSDFSLTSDSTLSTVSLDSGDVRVVGSTGERLSDIAFLGLSLFGVTATELVELNLNSGLATTIGSHGSSSANALVGHNGVLYAADVDGNIFTIDPDTAESTLIGTLGDGAGSSGDLVVSPDRDDTLYGTVKIESYATDVLVSIDIPTGESTVVGETGYIDVWGLAFFRDQFVGLTDSGQFILIDVKTGRSALISQDDALSTGGATVDSVGF